MADRLWWRDEGGRRRELLTPEGVPLNFTVAASGDRLVAFLIDAGIVVALLLALTLFAASLLTESVAALAVLASFLLFNFYFTWFEHRWQGRTPGKRARQLQVVDAAGGQLTVESVIVRNLTRYLEVIVPLSVLMAPEAIWPGAPPWGWVLATIWLVCFAFLPLFNRDRRRLGDLAAGTLVIRAPRVTLLSDLAAKKPRLDRWRREGVYAFTEAQLSRYGIYELQVLEEILRSPHSFSEGATIAKIREKVQARIGYEGEVADDLEFLRAFYAAQRSHLERKMLLGKRREDKHDDSG